jgi:hypothetical protein
MDRLQLKSQVHIKPIFYYHIISIVIFPPTYASPLTFRVVISAVANVVVRRIFAPSKTSNFFIILTESLKDAPYKPPLYHKSHYSINLKFPAIPTPPATVKAPLSNPLRRLFH